MLKRFGCLFCGLTLLCLGCTPAAEPEAPFNKSTVEQDMKDKAEETKDKMESGESEGDAKEGAGDTPAGDTPAGDTPAGDTPEGDTSEGDAADETKPE